MCQACMNSLTTKLEAVANGEPVDETPGSIPDGYTVAGVALTLNPNGTVTATMPGEAFAAIMTAAMAAGVIAMGPLVPQDGDE